MLWHHRTWVLGMDARLSERRHSSSTSNSESAPSTRSRRASDLGSIT